MSLGARRGDGQPTPAVSRFHIVEELVAQGFPATLDITAIVIWEREMADLAVIEGETSVTLEGHRLFTQAMHVDFGQLTRPAQFCV